PRAGRPHARGLRPIHPRSLTSPRNLPPRPAHQPPAPGPGQRPHPGRTRRGPHPPGLLRRLAVRNGRPDAAQDDYRRHWLRRIGVRRTLVSRARSAGTQAARAFSKGDNEMEYTRLGDTGLRISRLALGCMSYGDPTTEGAHRWALADDEAQPFFRQA